MNETVDAVPVAATIAELTTTERNEMVNAIRSLEDRHTSGKKKPYAKYDEQKRCEVAKFALNCSSTKIWDSYHNGSWFCQVVQGVERRNQP